MEVGKGQWCHCHFDSLQYRFTNVTTKRKSLNRVAFANCAIRRKAKVSGLVEDFPSVCELTRNKYLTISLQDISGNNQQKGKERKKSWKILGVERGNQGQTLILSLISLTFPFCGRSVLSMIPFLKRRTSVPFLVKYFNSIT
jgi:hypothetical protein